MIKFSEADRFEFGTISLFTGLASITFVPLIMKMLLIYVEPNFFRTIGGGFMFLSAVFYYLSPGFYKKQFLILGINLVIFYFFQSYVRLSGYRQDSSSIIVPILGIFLIFMSIYLDKNKK